MKIERLTLTTTRPNRYGAYQEDIVVRGDQIQEWRSLSELHYDETPVEQALAIINKACEGLESVTLDIHAESGYYDEGDRLVVGVKGFREPTPQERVNIAIAREQAKAKAKEIQDRHEAHEKAEYERLQKKFGK